MKNAYHILTDLHLAWKLNARKDYAIEIMHVLQKLLEIASENEKSNCNNILILLGDFYNRGFNDPLEAMEAIELSRFVFSKFSRVYAVIGNHELTYYKNNPFWLMVSEIKDKEVLVMRNAMKQPRGFNHDIDIVDTLVDGEVAFLFNHYNTRIKRPIINCNINIGLFHQNIASRDIPIEWGSFKDIDSDEELIGYNYLFLGHNHSNSYYGKYTLNNGSIAYFLASLGRPNHTEVDNNFLDRNIPVIYVENGSFIEISDNIFQLPAREECVIEEIVKTNQEAREKIKIKNRIYDTENIGSTLYDMTKNGAHIEGLDVVFELMQEPYANILKQYNILLKEGI